jgi:hypothetical protein
LKKIFIVIIALFSLVSCKKTEEIVPEKVVKLVPKKSEFGFVFADFNIVNDTIERGDTFGTLLEEQNIGDRKVYDIIAKVRDSFDVRSIRINRPFTLLRSKDKKHSLKVFIYQPDALSYYVVDMRDTAIAVYKKSKPITIKRRTIGGVLKESLSETLGNAKIEGALASKIAKIYAYSIDFMKLKKGDRFAITFTERFINDSVYDGVEELEASFFEYRGKIIYAFPFAQNPNSDKIDYYDEQGKTLKNFFLKSPIKFSRISSRFSSTPMESAQRN